MTRKIRWGILSTANIGGKRVIPALQQAANCEVVAVGSRDLARAQEFAKELKIPRAYGSYEELLADPEVDAIYNPLPNNMHAEWSIKCAEAGKPTLCEKPLASDAAEAQKMVNAFTVHGVPVAEAFMYRFHPQTQRVKTMLAEGAVGEIQLMQSSFTFRISREDNIRLSKSLAGGGLMDVGCYCLNVMRLMTGEEPEAVKAHAIIGGISNVDETLVGTLRFPSGALGHFDCGLRSYRAHCYEIRGSRGRIVVESAFAIEPNEETTIRYWHDNDYQEIKIPAVNHYTLMGEDFADALLNKRPPRFPIADAVDNMRVIDKLLASV